MAEPFSKRVLRPYNIEGRRYGQNPPLQVGNAENPVTIKTRRFSPAAHLRSRREVLQYPNEASLDEDPEVFVVALGHVARAYGISRLAEETGLNRESLYKACSGRTRPRWDTIHRVLAAMGLRLKAVA